MSYLLSIPPLENQDNLSGIRSIRVTRSEDVDVFPEDYEGIAQAELVFKPGKDWVLWASTYRTSQFMARGEDSLEGIARAQELPFVIPRHSEAYTTMLRKAERDQFIVLLEDHNGQRYLFGTKTKPVRFIFDLMSGNGTDRNQYACRFYSDAPSNLLIYPLVFGDGAIDFGSCPPVIVRRGDLEGPVLGIAPAGSTVVILSPYSFAFQLISS